MKRRVLAVCAGGALVGCRGWLALGIVVSSGRRHDVGGTWITGHVGPASALVVGVPRRRRLSCVLLGARSLYRFARVGRRAGRASRLRSDARLARGPRIVAIGGGTGLSVLLSGLKQHSSNLTAVVTVADDGGSSGLLRSGLGVLPPGDIRSCLVALADDESLMSRLFQYRFPAGRRPAGPQLRQPLRGRPGRRHRRLRARRAGVDQRAERARPGAAGDARERHAARRAAGWRAGGRRVVDHGQRASAAARLARPRQAAGGASGARGDRHRRPRRARPRQRLHEHRAQPAHPRRARGAQAHRERASSTSATS